MKINKLNYENYVIDYIEGTLSKELKKDFDLFLEKNEDVYDEIKDYISAPILEESTEVFIDKKSLKKPTGRKPYILLALIPILLIGAYFLIPSTTEKQKTKVEPQEIMNQFAQNKTTESKEIIKTEVVETNNMKSTSIEKQTLKKVERKTNNRKEDKKPKVLFASNNTAKGKTNTVIEPTPIASEAIAEVQFENRIESIASLETLPLKTFEDRTNPSMMNSTFVNIEPKDKSLLDQLTEKGGWLEMVTPASFEDIDLRESLAVESNININTSRKILNAFIPESLVK